MKNSLSRRSALRHLAGGAAVLAASTRLSTRMEAAEAALGTSLKGKVNHWLMQRDEVLAFCSAPRTDGGTGAVYVLLKSTD